MSLKLARLHSSSFSKKKKKKMGAWKMVKAVWILTNTLDGPGTHRVEEES